MCLGQQVWATPSWPRDLHQFQWIRPYLVTNVQFFRNFGLPLASKNSFGLHDLWTALTSHFCRLFIWHDLVSHPPTEPWLISSSPRLSRMLQLVACPKVGWESSRCYVTCGCCYEHQGASAYFTRPQRSRTLTIGSIIGQCADSLGTNGTQDNPINLWVPSRPVSPSHTALLTVPRVLIGCLRCTRSSDCLVITHVLNLRGYTNVPSLKQYFVGGVILKFLQYLL